jgi:hypothetical protein
MKKSNRLILAAATITLVALPAVSRAQSVNVGVAGSPHDFSTNSIYSWNTRKGVCSTCHAAHNTAEIQVAPLWAHATSTGPFVPYSSPTMTAVVGQPDGVSLACLSCHDGTVAINQGINGQIGSPTAPLQYIDPAAKIGPDLHTTHPISFDYTPALAATDGGLENPQTYRIGDPKTLLTVNVPPVPPSWSGTSLTGKTIKEALLVGDRMQCSSCHDVHKMEGSAPSSGILVRISGNDSTGRGSLICRTCHIK